MFRLINHSVNTQKFQCDEYKIILKIYDASIDITLLASL